MADTADVETALVTQINGIAYPNGVTLASALGAPAMVARGWPTEAIVAAAVASGKIIICVHALSGYARDSTRYPRDWQALIQVAPTVTASLSGLAITIGGTVTAGNIVGVLCKGAAYTYPAKATDTLSTIASGLASQIAGASASGAVLTLPTGGSLPAVVVVNGGTAAMEVARMTQVFAISLWAPSPALRDAAFATIWPAVRFSYRLTLPDGTVAVQMQAPGSGPDDVPSRMNMFRRDLRVTFDFPVIYTTPAPAIAALLQNYTPENGSTLAVASV